MEATTLTTPTGLPILDLRAEHARVCHLMALSYEAPRIPGIDPRRRRKLATRNLDRLNALLDAMPDADRAACAQSHARARGQWLEIIRAGLGDDDVTTRPLSATRYAAMQADLS